MPQPAAATIAMILYLAKDMKRILLAFAIVASIALSGCASRAEREALRRCAFSPTSSRMISQGGDSMVISVALEVRNPGPGAVVLDSFQVTASTSKPLARFSHGGTERIASGVTDTVNLRFAMASKELLSTAFAFMMSPPDSIALEGTAWVPTFFGLCTSEQNIRTKVPFDAIGSKLKGMLPSGGFPGIPAR